MNLRRTIRDIQRQVGVEDDGIFGPVTAGAVMRALNACEPGGADDRGIAGADSEIGGPLDPRTLSHIATLDSAAVEPFRKFARLAEATAAAMGCEYKGISGLRTWKEQDALYAKGRTVPGPRVTNARAGYSWHNYGVALDFGVFRGESYVDADNPGLAARVHAACAVHADECGLEWGGNWTRFKDLPHYQVAGLPSSPRAEHRKRYAEEGTIL